MEKTTLISIIAASLASVNVGQCVIERIERAERYVYEERFHSCSTSHQAVLSAFAGHITGSTPEEDD
jgi:hypothetical protein